MILIILKKYANSTVSENNASLIFFTFFQFCKFLYVESYSCFDFGGRIWFVAALAASEISEGISGSEFVESVILILLLRKKSLNVLKIFKYTKSGKAI